MKFGWDNIFASKGEDLGKLGQGIHALQDAMAHKGMRTNNHLGINISSVQQTLVDDMYGSTNKANNLTRSAFIISDLIGGKKVALKSGESLNVTGMSSGQLEQVLKSLIKQGFRGEIKKDEEN